MTFAADRLADLAVLFDTDGGFAETVAYTPAGGAARSVVAIVDRSGALDEIQRGGGMVGLPVARDVRADFTRGSVAVGAVVWLLAADAAAADYGDTVAFDGYDWTVRPAYRQL